MAGAVHRATFPAILIPSSANNLFHVQPPWGARWNRRVWARRNYEYKSANDGGGGLGGERSDDEDGLGGERGRWKRRSQSSGAGDENDAGNPAFAVF